MLIRQTLAYLPAQLFGPLIQFAVAISLTHFLSPADYGLTMLVFASQELIFLACVAWWTFYMLRYGGQFTDEAAKARFRATEMTVLMVTACVQVGVTLGLILVAIPGASAKFYAVAAAFVVTRSFVGFLSERARAEVRIFDYSLLQIAVPFGGLCFSLAALQISGAHASWVLAAFALVQGFVGLAIAFRLGIFASPRGLDRAVLRASLRFGLPMILSGALAWAAANIIRFVVQFMGGAEALGQLSVAWAIAIRLAAMAGMLVTAAAYPLAVKAFSAGDVSGARDQLSRNSSLLLLVMAPAVAGLIAINEPMVRLLISAPFQAVSIAILPAAILGAGLRNLRMHGWDQMYLLFEAQREMVLLESIEVLLTIGAAVAGMMVDHVHGAVVGVMISTLVVAIADYAFLRLKFGLHAPFSQYARIIGAALLMLAVLVLPARHGYVIPASWSGILLAALIGAGVYFVALMALFPRETRWVFGKLAERRRG